MHSCKPRSLSAAAWLGYWLITSASAAVAVDPVVARQNDASRELLPNRLEPMEHRSDFSLDHHRSSDAASTAYNIRRANDIGSYVFGYDNAKDSLGNEHFRFEQRFGNGTVLGEYGFTDYLNSAIVTVTYVADENGYRCGASSTVDFPFIWQKIAAGFRKNAFGLVDMELQEDHTKPLSHPDYSVSNDSDNKGAESLYQDDQNQQLIIEGILKGKQNCTSVDPTEYEDDEEEENYSKSVLDNMCYSDARMGICSICHLSIKENYIRPAPLERALVCSNGHLLCHQCVERFAIKLDANCVLCIATQCNQSVSSESRSSSIKRTWPKRKSRGLISRLHRKQQHNDGEAYATTMVASNSFSSRYNVGMSYNKNFVDVWNDSECEDTNEEELDQELPQVIKETKQRSYYTVTKDISSSNTIKSQISSQMMSEYSRRPIQCPLLDCAVNVAFSALTNHFIFDHPEVPILSVDPGEKRTLIVNFDGLAYNSSHCLALLLVSSKLSGMAAKQFSGSHVHPQYKNRLPLPILAARLHCDASHQDSVHTIEESRSETHGDVVIAWIAGLDIGKTTNGALRCSIQAIDNIDNEAFRSLKYTGPINSLRSAQKPREVFLTGDCVILHDGFINQITSGCENLNINVTIH